MKKEKMVKNAPKFFEIAKKLNLTVFNLDELVTLPKGTTKIPIN